MAEGNFFEAAGKAIGDAAGAVAKKADEFMRAQKLKARKTDLDNRVSSRLKAIGELVYEDVQNGGKHAEDVENLCLEITDLRNEIAKCREELAALRGEKTCKACGASMPAKAAFCMECGCKIPDPEPEPESPAEEMPEWAAEFEEPECEPWVDAVENAKAQERAAQKAAEEAQEAAEEAVKEVQEAAEEIAEE